MKKGMMVIAFFVALSVLVSMIAVAPLFAVKAPQTTPTTKQAPAQETPGSAANVKPASKPPVVKKEALLVRGTVTTNYGKGAEGIEITLIQLLQGTTGRTGAIGTPLDKNWTDSSGKYIFTISPDKVGKSFRVVPRLKQPCKNCPFSPDAKEFIFRNSITIDFTLHVPPPDTSISLLTMSPHADNGDYNQTILYEFEIKNKGFLPSDKSSFNLSFVQPCCPEDCITEQEVPKIPALGSIKISLKKSWNSWARGCQFTATVSPQQNEDKTDDNKVRGKSPDVKWTSIEVSQDTNAVYVRNKGTSTPEVDITWLCRDDQCDPRCVCPPLVPTTPAAPSFPQIRNSNEATKMASIAPNETWVYPIPSKLAQWGATYADFTAKVRAPIANKGGSAHVHFK